MLENENKFTDKTADMITSFLEHLQNPICLIAHNGKHLDFPLLKKYFSLVDKKLGNSVKFIDSLDAFRDIEKSEEIENEIIKNERIELNDDNEIDYEKLNETTPSRSTIPINMRGSKKTPTSDRSSDSDSSSSSSLGEKRVRILIVYLFVVTIN